MVKLYKVRASTKMHKKMYRLYNMILSSNPQNAKEYIKKWTNFSALNGIYQTVNYIEPITKEKRKNIGKLISAHYNDFLIGVSVKKVKLLKWEQKIYDAYRSKTLKEFSKKNRNALIKKNSSQNI
jgi:hypothetical protein